ncbi:hypothetical protein ACWCQM_11805, partial [Streptomyces sp. NPDC002125]
GQAAVWPCETATALAVARQVLGTTTGQPETATTVDRRARYAAAIRDTDGWVLDDGQHMLDAVMAVADNELAELRADRATVLNEAADRVDATDLPDDYIDMFDNGARWATAVLRRMAAEAQQPTPDVAEVPVSPTAALLAARCDDCQHVLDSHLRYGACLHDGCTCRRYHPAP